MATVDSSLRFNLIAMFRGCSQLLTAGIAITYTEPAFLAAVVPLGIAYYFIQVRHSSYLFPILSFLFQLAESKVYGCTEYSQPFMP